MKLKGQENKGISNLGNMYYSYFTTVVYLLLLTYEMQLRLAVKLGVGELVFIRVRSDYTRVTYFLL